MAADNFFQDRLAVRQHIDRWGFLLFASVGSATILVTKSLSVEAVLVAVVASLMMVGYAAVAGYGSTKLQADQAGDNCYYLGLIYTLASLSFAIFTFDPANTATTIVQGFGVALATTILGLILRVFFSQSRVDLVDTEESARIALAEAAAQVRAQLDGAVQALSTFSTQTQQHLLELRSQVKEDISSVGEKAREAVDAASIQSVRAMEAQSTETVTETRKVATAVGKLVSSLENHSNALAEIEIQARGQLAHLSALESAAGGAKAAMAHVSQAASDVQAGQQVLIKNSDHIRSATDVLANRVQSLEQAAIRFEQALQVRVDDINQAPLKGIADAERAMRDVLSNWSSTVDLLVNKQSEFVSGLDDLQANQLKTIGEHNAALEVELKRSRDNVTQVHQALVDMTTQLANDLENQTPQ